MSKMNYCYGVYPTVIYSAVTPSGQTIHLEIKLGLEAFSLQIGEEEEDLSATLLEIREYEGYTSLRLECPHRSEILAHGLYRLGLQCCGFDLSYNCIINNLPSLGAHEKLELRLSLPREFWPQKWRVDWYED
jgi:hypothetical protein